MESLAQYYFDVKMLRVEGNMRLSDPTFTKVFVEARLEALRGGRPLRRGRRNAPRAN